jgi:peroxiredoxin
MNSRYLLPRAAGFLLAATVLASAVDPPRFTFERGIGNVEIAATSMWPQPPPGVKRLPESVGRTWYGLIMRRLPEDLPTMASDHYVPFVAEYQDGAAVRAWCDTDFDGDLSDEPPIPLAEYPGIEGARSFLAQLKWTSRLEGREIPMDWTVRVVLESEPAAGGAPRSRVQMVYAMTGTVTVEGKPHRAFLFDGTVDGFYTRNLFDGLFVDLDDDGHVLVDQMSSEFGSFEVPFTLGHTSFEVVALDPAGRELSLRELGPAPGLPPAPEVGKPAPTFSFVDTSGRSARLPAINGRCVLVYFWASWCPACAAQSAGLTRLYDRFHDKGLEILAVSYDTDRAAMERFRKANAQSWPTSFSGKKAWEDPVGKIYRERATGSIYLIDPAGVLQGTYTDVAQLEPAVEQLLGPGGQGRLQSPAASVARP